MKNQTAAKYADFVPFVSGLMIVFCSVGRIVGNSVTVSDVIFSDGLFSLAYPVFFMWMGLYLSSQEDFSLEIGRRRMLAFFGRAFAVCAGLTLFFTVLSGFASGHMNPGEIFFALLRSPAAGLPTHLWILPAAILCLILQGFAEKTRREKPMLVLGGILYVLSVVVSFYGRAFPFFSPVASFADGIFTGGHCGFFSAVFPFLLGLRLHTKEKRRFRTLLAGFVLSLLLLVCEAWYADVFLRQFSRCFYLASVPAAWFFLRILQRLPSIPEIDGFSARGVGMRFLCAAPACLSILALSGGRSDSVFSAIIHNRAGLIELTFLLAVSVSFGVFAFYEKETWSAVFLRALSKTIRLVLAPVRFMMLGIGKKGRDAMLVLSFAMLPVLLWCMERQIGYQICTSLFSVCLAVVLFCSLPEVPPSRSLTSLPVVLFFGMCAWIRVVSLLYGIPEYMQISAFTLYFLFPLVLMLSGQSDGMRRLMDLYAVGLYLSFGIFVLYCLMFRPYDITRYRGAFANANMCGLYLVAVFGVAVSRCPDSIDLKTIRKNFPEFLVAGTSLGFILFTISRTALAGALACVSVRLVVSSLRKTGELRKDRRAVLRGFRLAGGYLAVFAVGTVLAYLGIRFVPAVFDRPLFLQVELTEQFPYKVLPGASVWDANYISPLRVIQSWVNRSPIGSETLNDFSTGRIDIYTTFLSQLGIWGHAGLRLPVSPWGELMFAHNAFLQLAYNCGVISGAVFLLAVAAVLIKGVSLGRKSELPCYSAVAAAGYIVCGMFESMETQYYPLLLFFFLSAGYLFCEEYAAAQPCVPVLPASPRREKQAAVLRKVYFSLAVVICWISVLYLLFLAMQNENRAVLNDLLR